MTNPVQDLLDKHRISYRPSGRDFITRCFNPEHNDSNPSFRVDQVSGIGHCFSCGFKFNIFKYYGVLTNNVSIKIAKLKEKLKSITEQLTGLDYPEGYTPFSGSFRGISSQTLKKFGAFTTDRVDALNDRLCFPIPDITGKTSVFVARHTLSSASPRYVNYPGGVAMPLYPCMVPTPECTTIVLVEGLMDMLRLYDKGIHNSICCFGTNTLQSNTSEKLLAFKAQGITKVFILFDGDIAGRDAAKKLKPLIEEEGFLVEIVDLPDNEDPGSLGDEDILSIKEYVDGYKDK